MSRGTLNRASVDFVVATPSALKSRPRAADERLQPLAELIVRHAGHAASTTSGCVTTQFHFAGYVLAADTIMSSPPSTTTDRRRHGRYRRYA
jgi:hypothetical protein